MDWRTEMDKELESKVKLWREPFEDYAKEVVGVVLDVLDATQCQKGECESKYQTVSNPALNLRMVLTCLI